MAWQTACLVVVQAATMRFTDGIGAIEIPMTLFDRTERYEERPMPKRPPPAAARPLAGFRNVLSYEAGLAGSALTGRRGEGGTDGPSPVASATR